MAIGRPRVNDERNAQIAMLFRSGYLCRQIGEIYGISVSAVGLILKEQGVDRSDGGKAVVARLRREADKENDFFNRYGVAPHRLGGLIAAKSVVRKYMRQRARAAARGIGWDLTLSEWWEIWQSSGQWENRGRRAEMYVMARHKDQGPYSADNVQIKTLSENMAEFWQCNPDHKPNLKVA